MNNKLETSTKTVDHAELMAEGQLQKLQLEIRQLRKPRWLDPFLQILPLVTVLVSVLGFVWTAFQYFEGQKKARSLERTQQTLKLEEQARTNLQRITQFPSDQKITRGEIEVLLIDLQRVQTLLSAARQSDGSLNYASQSEFTTEILANLVNGMSFHEPREVDFADVVLRDWSQYADYIKTNQVYVKNILAKQEDALTELRRRYPKYFAGLTMNDTGGYNEPKGATTRRNEFRAFEKLMLSYEEHLKLLTDDSFRQHSIKSFQAAICNAQLTKRKFGMSFRPQDDPQFFSECLK
ncbi:MAG TPA: hypothetical protein VFZ40_19125 [Pyrinomonadaceae bacterium]